MRFRLTAPSGQVIDEGEGRAAIEGGAIVVAPTLGQPLRIKPTDVVEVSEPEPYLVRLRLAEGPVLDLAELGHMRTQLLAEIGDVRVEDTISSLLLAGVGRPERFPGTVNGADADIRLYDDALVVVPLSGAPEQVPYAFVESVETDASGYKITVDTGDGVLVVQRMTQRTTEFLELLRRRVTDARGRTSAFLQSLLPGLGSLGLRAAAGILRDGVAASKADLDAIEPTIWSSLTGAATAPARVRCLEVLEGLGPPAIGFKQTVSVTREASGGEAWSDPSASPNIGGHGGDQGRYQMGLAGALQGQIGHDVMTGGMGGGLGGGLGFDAPFGRVGGLLALQALGNPGGSLLGGMGSLGGTPAPPGHEMTARDDMTRGTATAETADVSALDTGSAAPSILAFAFSYTPSGALVYEVLNEGDHATYVYKVDRAGVRRLNRALVLVGFRVESIYSDAQTVGSKYKTAVERLPYLSDLRTAFVGRAVHTDNWEAQLRALL